MSPVPSEALAAAIAECERCRYRGLSLCEAHEAAWEREASLGDSPMANDVGHVMSLVLGDAGGRDTLLGAYRTQLRALELVWEAHERGAIRLPSDVAAVVRQARTSTPDFLRGASPAAPVLHAPALHATA